MIDPPFLWASDIHLDFAGPFGLESFTNSVNESDLPALLVTGDITNAVRLDEDLPKLIFPHKTTYIVLGNHDYFGGDLATSVANATARTDLIYLPKLDHVELSSRIYLIGVDGYADGGAGDFIASTIWLNDYNLIADFASCATKRQVLEKLQALGRASGCALRAKLATIPLDAETIYVATHAPPFIEANWYDDKPSRPEFLPHFTNVALGVALRAEAQARPQTHFVVLCGHVHWGTHVHVSDNIECFVGWAKYEYPVVQDLAKIPLRAVPLRAESRAESRAE